MTNIIDKIKINGVTYYLVPAAGEGGSGISPTITVTPFDGGQRLTITDVKGTKSVDILNGANGQNGAQGAPGKDGEPYVLTEADKDTIVQAAAAELGTRIEVRPQAVTVDGNRKRIYWEDLTGISDESFFMLSGYAPGYNHPVISLTIPVSLVRSGTDGYVAEQVGVTPDCIFVESATYLSCKLYVLK